MADCLNCGKYNALADENEKILDKYNLLKLEYDKYDNICFDCGIVGFIIGVILTLSLFLII